MKKVVILLCLSLSLALTACGDDAKVIEGNVQNVTSAESKTESTNTVSSNDEVAEKGFVFDADGVLIAMDVDAAPIIEALGEPGAYFEAPSCAFEGIDKMYTYNSFELDTYPQGDRDFVSTVIFKDDVIHTKEGIAIGDAASKVYEVYGNQYSEEKGMQVFEKDGMKLCFIIKDDVVAAIEYRSTVLDE